MLRTGCGLALLFSVGHAVVCSFLWRLYFADTYILSPHNSTTVDCRSDESDSSLSEVHRYLPLSLFCFSWHLSLKLFQFSRDFIFLHEFS